MHTNYIQMPPDSTGKKVGLAVVWLLPVADASAFFEGDHITGATSGTEMHVVQRNTYSNNLYCKVRGELQDAGTFTVGENLLVAGVIKSTVSGAQTPIYHNFTSVVSHDNPFHGQRVDAQGQAYIRYEEGAQILDAVGRSKTSIDRISGQYRYTTDDCWSQYMQTTIVGTASNTIDTNNFARKLSTGTALNDSVALTSHKYHAHVPGGGLYAEIVYQCGDAGKENLHREWGYADADNGIFFDLMGTELNVVTRDSSSGSLVETEFLQSAWNRDKLDGTGISGVTLDVTKINKYWFDFNRGVRFRFGIFAPNGARIVCHDIYIANTASQLKMPNTSLPLRVVQFNNGAVISTSESTFYEGVVMVEGRMDMHKHFYEAGGTTHTVTSAAWVPLVSLRPQTLSKHTIATLLDLAVTSVLASDGNIDGRIKVEIFKNATLTGATFATIKGDSRFEVDTAATAMTGGTAVVEFIVKGTDNKDVENHFSYLNEFLIQHINGDKNTYTLAAKAVAADCDVLGAITWNEYFVR